MISYRNDFLLLSKKIDEQAMARDLQKMELKRVKKDRAALEKRHENGQKALALVQQVAQETQKELEFHIENLVTMALSSVFEDNIEFVARFVIRRNQPECDLLFRENGVEQDPTDCSGGGTIDVASFALRIVKWSLNKNRPAFVLDEPFRNVSPDLHPKVSDMVNLLSRETQTQIIMVSHAADINVAADRTFLVTKKNGKSFVKEVKNFLTAKTN